MGKNSIQIILYSIYILCKIILAYCIIDGHVPTWATRGINLQSPEVSSSGHWSFYERFYEIILYCINVFTTSLQCIAVVIYSTMRSSNLSLELASNSLIIYQRRALKVSKGGNNIRIP